MTETPTPEALTVSFAPVDREHAAQINLLNPLEAAVNGGRGAEARALFEQFVELTNAHFLSEQLIMRNHAYEA